MLSHFLFAQELPRCTYGLSHQRIVCHWAPHTNDSSRPSHGACPILNPAGDSLSDKAMLLSILIIFCFFCSGDSFVTDQRLWGSIIHFCHSTQTSDRPNLTQTGQFFFRLLTLRSAPSYISSPFTSFYSLLLATWYLSHSLSLSHPVSCERWGVIGGFVSQVFRRCLFTYDCRFVGFEELYTVCFYLLFVSI